MKTEDEKPAGAWGHFRAGIKLAKWVFAFAVGALSILIIAQDALAQRSFVPILQAIVDIYDGQLTKLGALLQTAIQNLTSFNLDFLQPYWTHVLALFVTLELGIIWRTMGKAKRADVAPMLAYFAGLLLLIVPTTLFAAIVAGMSDPRVQGVGEDASPVWGNLIGLLLLMFFGGVESATLRGKSKSMRTVGPLLGPMLVGLISLCLPAVGVYMFVRVANWNGYIVGMFIFLLSIGLSLLLNRVVFSKVRLALAAERGRYDEALAARNDSIPLAMNLLGGLALAAIFLAANLALQASGVGGSG